MVQENKVLEQELDRLQDQMGKLETALEEKPDYGLGEGDPAITRWELNQALLAQLKERIKSVEQALSRANRGAYGVCVQCGRQIHPDRLAVLPDTRVCIDCARKEQSS